MVKTSVQRKQVQSLVRKLRFHIPLGQKIQNINRSNTVTNSIKTLKMVHITKSSLKNRTVDKEAEVGHAQTLISQT